MAYENHPAFFLCFSDPLTLRQLGSYRFPVLAQLKLFFPPSLSSPESWAKEPAAQTLWSGFFEQHGGIKHGGIKINHLCFGVDLFGRCPFLEELDVGQMMLYCLQPSEGFGPGGFFVCPGTQSGLMKVVVERVHVSATRKQHDAQFRRGFESLEFRDFPELKEMQ
ncbi:hypothetical protein BDV98DRAFT_606883 [Pterulicium gracile]|uniref:Uncharacterized protein n=1 Tax=Pterulicium gracile TaxID=1884261 RepID=A0A5C3Q9R2_9AGAR|nr:hypothetical protein BDV98DRAFT_606883 [Pterula gracilis]